MKRGKKGKGKSPYKRPAETMSEEEGQEVVTKHKKPKRRGK